MPAPTKLTVSSSPGSTEHTEGVDDVTDGAPSLLVVRDAVKPLPPKVGLAGMSLMIGAFGLACATPKLWGLPSAAR